MDTIKSDRADMVRLSTDWLAALFFTCRRAVADFRGRPLSRTERRAASASHQISGVGDKCFIGELERAASFRVNNVFKVAINRWKHSDDCGGLMLADCIIKLFANLRHRTTPFCIE